MRGWLRDHGLLLVNLLIFVVCFAGMIIAGVQAYNAEQSQHGHAAVSLAGYLFTGQFVEATFENWESEFLQMGMYVVLTAYLFERGSAESKPIDKAAPQDADPRHEARRANLPWPVRRGGWVLTVYENSLAALFLVLFALSVLFHAIGGASAYSQEQLDHGGSAVSAWEYLRTSQFWFESFQNWQSEFMVMALVIGASVYLRQVRSPESKPVATPHLQTGS